MNLFRLVALSITCIIILAPTTHAQDFDPKPYLGENWFGLYMNGAKIGYSSSNVTVDSEGLIHSEENAIFKLNMAGIKQEMAFKTQRIYGKDGALQEVNSNSEDISGKNKFHAIVKGEQLILTSYVGGQKSTKTLPKPTETLQDMERIMTLVANNPKIGDTVTFKAFEPMYATEIEAIITILEQEERILDGVKTKVYKTESKLPTMGITSIGYISEDGTTLEEKMAGVITIRLEPKEIALNANYANDTIISNAAIIDLPITKARTRDELTLRISGPLTEDLILNDANQIFTIDGDAYIFVGKKLSIKNANSPNIPITEASVQQWIKPTTFVQSDNELLINKAKEIIGEETNSAKISEALSNWVSENMTSTFSARLSNSLEVLDSLEGDCTEHSMLFIGLARAAGLPAHEVAGLIYAPGPNPGFYFHQWAKVWVGEWIEVDPTFNQPLADATHIRLVEGELMEQSKLLPVIGKLNIEVVE
jgi:hypothetical protein